MISRIIIAFGLCFSFIILSCEGDKLLNTSKQISKMEISVSGLNVPGDSTWYEAWLFPKDGSSVDTILSLGRLSLSDGQYVTSMNVNSGYLQGAERIILSMEREDIPSQSYDINGNTGTKGPNQFWILSAELAANEATLNVGTVNNFDFSLSQAEYIIDTPTDPQSLANKAGIWFTRIDTTHVLDSLGNIVEIDTMYNQGLNIPELVTGWTYECILLSSSDTLQIGEFTKPTGADNFSDFSGVNGTAYAFPGEDFIQNAPAGFTFPFNIEGSEIKILIHPNYPEKANEPFVVEAFKGIIPNNSAVKTNLVLDANPDGYPLGDVIIDLNLY